MTDTNELSAVIAARLASYGPALGAMPPEKVADVLAADLSPADVNGLGIAIGHYVAAQALGSSILEMLTEVVRVQGGAPLSDSDLEKAGTELAQSLTMVCADLATRLHAEFIAVPRPPEPEEAEK